MKIKIFIGLILVAAVTSGIWYQLHRIRSSELQGEKQVTLTKAPSQTPERNVQQKPAAPNSTQTISQPITKLAANASPVVQMIVDQWKDYRQREDAVIDLTTNLSADDVQTLKAFLLQRSSGDDQQLGQVLKNDLLDALCMQKPPPPWLVGILIQIYRDRSQNEVVRDYAVQYMSVLYEQLRLSGQDDSDAKRVLRQALGEALNETGDSVAGTALLGLARLSNEAPNDFDKSQLTQAALQLTGDGTGELVRITAFQICGQLGISKALPTIFAVAQNNQTSPLRISAIAALGPLAGTNQIPFLQDLINGSDSRIKPAARYALAQITFRQSQLVSQK